MSQYYDLNMTGGELSEILGKVLANETAIADETLRAQNAEAAIETEVLEEKERAQAAESTKQGVISDLDAIRSGAAKGATALQQHQSLENYYTKTETNDVVNDNVHEAVAMIDTSTLVLSPDCLIQNVGANVTITATTKEAAEITIRDNHHVIAQNTGVSLTAVESFIPTSEDYIEVNAVFIRNGISHTVTERLLVVQPVKYGAGLTVASATTNASARKTADGEYTFAIPEGGGFLWLCVPVGMKLTKVLMSDVEMELEDPDTTTMQGYVVYRSANMFEEGSVTALVIGSEPYNL